MSEVNEQAEKMDIDTALNEGFDRAFAKMQESQVEAEPGVMKGSGESAEDALDASQAGPQDEGVENPGDGDPVSEADLADALDEIRRSGLPPASLKGKSEAQILALGTELSTKRRQRDREYLERQNRESEGQQTDPAPDEAEPTDGAEGEADAGNPGEAGDEQFTALVDELGEEAARPLIDRLQAADRRVAEMQAKLDAREQERQLAPVIEAANKVLDGLGDSFPALSNPESRDQVIQAADKLGAAFADKYSALPESERLDSVLRDAAVQVLGEPVNAAPTQRRIADAAAATTSDVPQARPGSLDEVLDAGFNRAWEKHHGRA